MRLANRVEVDHRDVAANLNSFFNLLTVIAAQLNIDSLMFVSAKFKPIDPTNKENPDAKDGDKIEMNITYFTSGDDNFIDRLSEDVVSSFSSFVFENDVATEI